MPETTGDVQLSMQLADSQARGCDLEIMDIHITSDYNKWLCAQQPQFESQLQACALHKVIFLSALSRFEPGTSDLWLKTLSTEPSLCLYIAT